MFLFLFICVIALKRARLRRSMNAPLPRVTNPRHPNVTNIRSPNCYNYRAQNLILTNSQRDNLAFNNPDVYQINLDQYQNRTMSNQQSVNFQKATKDDLPSYEEIVSSSQGKGENPQNQSK
jgi:hypothetical protein